LITPSGTPASAKARISCAGEAGVSSGRLLPEFQIHFSVLEFSMPPLRDRRPEFAGIVESLQPRLIRADGSMATVSPEAVTVLQGWTWPGNFRELITVLGDALEAVESGPILPAHLPRWLREKAAIAADPPVKEGPGPNLDAILELVEQRLIARALTKHRNNVTKAAEWLGIPRIRLVRRIEALKPGTAGPITREG
jgi:DNA-binding NtrC family response regulator